MKIERSFVSELTTRSERQAILWAIGALANSLNQPIVSDGIETDEPSQVLQSTSCQFGEAFLFGKALDDVAASTPLERWRDANVAA